MLRKGIGSAGDPYSSASDLLNMRTRYTRHPRKQQPRKLFFQKAKLDFDRATHLYDRREPSGTRLRFGSRPIRLKSRRAEIRSGPDERGRNHFCATPLWLRPLTATS